MDFGRDLTVAVLFFGAGMMFSAAGSLLLTVGCCGVAGGIVGYLLAEK